MAFKNGKWQSEVEFSKRVINSSNPEKTSRKSTKDLDDNAKTVGNKNKRATIEDVKAVIDDYENGIAGYNGKSADWLIALCYGDTDSAFSGEASFSAKWCDKDTYKDWAAGVKERWESEIDSNALDIENAVIQSELKDALSETGEYWKTKGIDIVADTLGWSPFGEGSFTDYVNDAIADIEAATDYLTSDEYRDLILIKQRAADIRENPLGYRIHTLSSLHSSPFNTKIMPGGLSTKTNHRREKGWLKLSNVLIYPDSITRVTFGDNDHRSYNDGDAKYSNDITKAYLYSTEDLGGDASKLDSKYWYGTTNILTSYPQNRFNTFFPYSYSSSEALRNARASAGINVIGDLKTSGLVGEGFKTMTLRQYIEALDERASTKDNGDKPEKWSIASFSITRPSTKKFEETVHWNNYSDIDGSRWKWESGSAKEVNELNVGGSAYSTSSSIKEEAYKSSLRALKAMTNEKFIGKDGIDKLFTYDPGTVISRVIMQQCFENGYNMYMHIAPLSYGPGKTFTTREAAVKATHDALLKAIADDGAMHRLGQNAKYAMPTSIEGNGVYDATWLLYTTCQQMMLAAGGSKSLLKKINPDSWNTLLYRAEGITVPSLGYKAANSKCFGMDVPMVSKAFDQSNIATVSFRLDRELAMLYTLGVASGYAFETASLGGGDKLMSMSFTDLLGTGFYNRYAIFISTGHFGSADIARELMQANQIDRHYTAPETEQDIVLNQSGQKVDSTVVIDRSLQGKTGKQEHYHLFHMFNDVKFLGLSGDISFENVAQGKAISLPVSMAFKDIETLTEHWVDGD